MTVPTATASVVIVIFAISFFSIIIVTTTTTTIYGEQQQTIEEQEQGHQYNEVINNWIDFSKDLCSDIENSDCFTVMDTISKKFCQVDYFPECFGKQWDDYFFIMYNTYKYNEDYNDEYLNINNQHFGNENWDN